VYTSQTRVHIFRTRTQISDSILRGSDLDLDSDHKDSDLDSDFTLVDLTTALEQTAETTFLLELE